jgi:ATP-dependent DNA helicase RecG
VKPGFIYTPIEYLKGIGPQRAEVLKKELNIFTYRDLLTYYPFRYVDRTKFSTIREISDELQYVQIKGIIDSLEIVGSKQAKRLVVIFRDNTGIIELVFFKGYNWVAQKLQVCISSCCQRHQWRLGTRCNIGIVS